MGSGEFVIGLTYLKEELFLPLARPQEAGQEQP